MNDPLRTLESGYGPLMKSLLVEIFADGLLIGTVELKPADPSMGVAGGIFHPNPAYAPEIHARQSELSDQPTPRLTLTARDRTGAPIECAGVDLVDFSQTVGDEGRELHVLGMGKFQAFFGG